MLNENCAGSPERGGLKMERARLLFECFECGMTDDNFDTFCGLLAAFRNSRTNFKVRIVFFLHILLIVSAYEKILLKRNLVECVNFKNATLPNSPTCGFLDYLLNFGTNCLHRVFTKI